MELYIVGDIVKNYIVYFINFYRCGVVPKLVEFLQRSD